MERLVVSAQEQAEATTRELSLTAQENSQLRETAEGMQMELHRLKAEKIVQEVSPSLPASKPKKHPFVRRLKTMMMKIDVLPRPAGDIKLIKESLTLI